MFSGTPRSQPEMISKTMSSMGQSNEDTQTGASRDAVVARLRWPVPSILVSEFYKAGNALVRFNHPGRNCGNL